MNLRLFLDPQRFPSKTRGIACLLRLALPPTKTIVQSDPPPTSVRKESVVASPVHRDTQRRRTPARGCELPLARAVCQKAPNLPHAFWHLFALSTHGFLPEVSQAPNGSFDSNGAFFFQHSTFVLGEVCRLDPSGFSRLDRLRLRRPCLLPLLRAPCERLSGF